MGTTRALGCSDRRPRRSVEDAGPSLNGSSVERASVFREARNTAREGACAPGNMTWNILSAPYRRRYLGITFGNHSGPTEGKHSPIRVNM